MATFLVALNVLLVLYSLVYSNLAYSSKVQLNQVKSGLIQTYIDNGVNHNIDGANHVKWSESQYKWIESCQVE